MSRVEHVKTNPSFMQAESFAIGENVSGRVQNCHLGHDQGQRRRRGHGARDW